MQKKTQDTIAHGLVAYDFDSTYFLFKTLLVFQMFSNIPMT